MKQNTDLLKKRKGQRLKGFDYSECGLYFVTFNVIDDNYTLSRISDSNEDDKFVGKTARNNMTQYGNIVKSQIELINESEKRFQITNYVIMPNHIHMMVEILDEFSTVTLSQIVGLLKRKCNKEFGRNIWQKSFYDHIITNDEDYYNHLVYIEDNPKKWLIGKDKYYE